jgi:hypothetical protein
MRVRSYTYVCTYERKEINGRVRAVAAGLVVRPIGPCAGQRERPTEPGPRRNTLRGRVPDWHWTSVGRPGKVQRFRWEFAARPPDRLPRTNWRRW